MCRAHRIPHQRASTHCTQTRAHSHTHVTQACAVHRAHGIPHQRTSTHCTQTHTHVTQACAVYMASLTSMRAHTLHTNTRTFTHAHLLHRHVPCTWHPSPACKHTLHTNRRTFTHAHMLLRHVPCTWHPSPVCKHTHCTQTDAHSHMHTCSTGMCRAHGIPHQRASTPEEYQQALNSAWGLNRHSVVEVSWGCVCVCAFVYTHSSA
jgi:hypothetical protein